MGRRVVPVVVVLVVAGCAPRSEPVAPTADHTPLAAIEDERAAFAEAHRLVTDGRCAAAIPILASLLDGYPKLQDYTLHFLAECRARLGDDAAAAELWERLRTRHPSSVHLTAALLGLARIARRSGNFTEARSLLGEVRRRAGGGEARTASWMLAEIDEDSGDWRAANERFMQIRREVPGTSLGRRAKQRVARLRERFPWLAPRGEELEEEELSLLVREGDSGGALRLAERLLASAPADRAPRVLFLRADAERAAGRFDDALATLATIAARHPQSTIAPEALYRRASWLWNRDRDEEAKRDFTELLRCYPGAREAETLYALGRIEEAAGRPARAIATYARLARAHPGETQAAWRIGWVLYQEGRWREAAEQFSRAETGDRGPALYWRARALDRAGERGEAVRVYRLVVDEEPAGYYALWAQRRLGVRPAEATVATRPVEARIDVAAAPAAAP
jgi:TolA-binding protein